MTSIEVAEITEKKHLHVMRDIRSLIDQGAITESNFGLSEYKDASGKSNPMYSLDFKASMVLVTGYDAVKRAAVIDRWVALETGEAKPAIQAKKRAPRQSIPHKQAHDIIKYEMQIGKLLGTDAPMAKAIAVEDARRETGLDFTKLLPMAELKEIPVGIRKIAPLAGVKEGQVSAALLALGLGEKDDKGKWSITEKGKQLKAGSMEPFKSQHSEHVGYTCKWFESVVVPLIKQHIVASTSN